MAFDVIFAESYITTGSDRPISFRFYHLHVYPRLGIEKGRGEKVKLCRDRTFRDPFRSALFTATIRTGWKLEWPNRGKFSPSRRGYRLHVDFFPPQPCLRVLQANVLYFFPRFLDDDDRSIDRSTQCLMIHPDNSSNSWKYSKELNIFFFFFLLKKDSPIPRSIDTVCLTIYLSGRRFFEFVQVFKGIGRI